MRSSLLFRMELPRNKSWLFVTLFITGWVFVSLWTCIFVTLSSFLILGWFVGAVSGEHWFCPGELCLYVWLCDIEEYPANWCIEEFDFQFYVSICSQIFFNFQNAFHPLACWCLELSQCHLAMCLNIGDSPLLQHFGLWNFGLWNWRVFLNPQIQRLKVGSLNRITSGFFSGHGIAWSSESSSS